MLITLESREKENLNFLISDCQISVSCECFIAFLDTNFILILPQHILLLSDVVFFSFISYIPNREEHWGNTRAFSHNGNTMQFLIVLDV